MPVLLYPRTQLDATAMMPAPGEPRLRPASNRDREAVTDLVFSVLREFELKPDPEDTDADLNDIEKSYFETGGRFDVLEDSGGKIVGSVGLAGIGAGICVLRKMYLLPEYRGHGLGERLLFHAIEQARALGFGRINLETASVLEKANALYIRHGFQPFHDPDLPARCDQAYYLDLGRNE